MADDPSAPPPWFASLRDARLVSGRPAAVTAVEHDSRLVAPQAAFVAIPGLVADGNAFIADALTRGATAVVVQEDRASAWAAAIEGTAACVVAVRDARAALAKAAAGLYGHPARALGVIGITGTDGKTTTTHLVAHVLTSCGLPAGYLSSVAFSDGRSAQLNATHMTTVEANAVQRQLAAIRDTGARFAAVEASSIGLDLHRVDECEFDVGVFTNLTPDHLDYHGDMEHYREAKAELFRMVSSSVSKQGIKKAAVLCADDDASEHMRSVARVPVTTYGLRATADVRASGVRSEGFETQFDVEEGGKRFPARVGLVGAYNVSNCLAAVAVARSQGVAAEDAARALASFPGVPGRLERIECGQAFRVFVDIASTGPAMRNVLAVLRPLTSGRIFVVFGAAGERDRTRRSAIAQAVAEYANGAIITNEDPRSEDPEAIMDEIAAAFDAVGFQRYHREPDRRAALDQAFRTARQGDVVLLAGKGTEQSMVFGTRHVPWDERAVARDLLAAM